MSATLKLGTDGNWAAKKGSVLSYNDENGNFKPLPFTFDRSTSATRVNKEGLIEVVSNNEPRIDFLNDSKGALLLEPSRTNLATYSEDFSQSYWPTTGASVQGGFASPSVHSNLGSFKLIENTNNSIHGINHTFVGITSNTDYSFSINIKSNGRQWVYFKPFDWIGSYIWFDVLNGVVGNISNHPSFTFKNSKINKLANGFFNVSFSVNTTFPQIQIGLALTTSNNDFLNYIGDGTSGIYIYGAQIEQGSYATSYIPTQGSAVTRLADSCSQTVPDGVIGQTEGTVLLDFEFIASDDVKVLFSLDGNAYNKRIEFWMNEDVLNGFIGGSVNIPIGNTTITKGRYKAAIAYDELGNQAFYVNGVQIGISTTPYTISNLDNLRFNVWSGGSSLKTSIKTKDIKLYNTRLSNSELAALTS